jgi:hypothetical protein
MSSGTTPVITRCYRESSEVEPCAQAVRLILDFADRNKEGGCATARDAAEESENGCDAKTIVPR